MPLTGEREPPRLSRRSLSDRRIRFLLAVAKRLAIAALTVWIVSLVVFAIVEVLPQDPARLALGREASESQLAAFRERMHLNDPALERYGRWAAGMLRGDFGVSVLTERPISDELLPSLKYTTILTLISIVVGTAIAIPLAMLAAQRAGRATDILSSSVALGISAVPEFVVAILLLLVFAAELKVLPILSIGVRDGDVAAYVLPSATLALAVAAYTFRLGRVAIAEALARPYVRAAVLNGTPRRAVLWKHVLPNVAPVVANATALNVLFLLGGVVVVEVVFSYPGIGRFFLEAVMTNDFPSIEGAAVVMSALFVAINLLVDAGVVALDPRLRSRMR